MSHEADGNGFTGAIATVLVADRHPAVREALMHRLLPEPDLRVCGECSTIAEMLEMTKAERPDIVVLEVFFSDGSGFDFLTHVKLHGLPVRALVWSSFEPHLYAERAVRAGAWGYVSKDRPTAEVVAVVRQIRDGERYLPDLADNVAATNGDGNGAAIQTLSNRELEVFQWLGEGLDMQDIGRRLGVSVKTVETYRARIKQKLGIKGRSDLIRCAVEWSLDRRRNSSSSHLNGAARASV
jgi:DNA-binding NarL/FixJ family response regulator